jgi:hypothetical protein
MPVACFTSSAVAKTREKDLSWGLFIVNRNPTKLTAHHRLARAVRPEAVGTRAYWLRERPGCLEHHARWVAGGPQGTVPLPAAAGLTARARPKKHRIKVNAPIFKTFVREVGEDHGAQVSMREKLARSERLYANLQVNTLGHRGSQMRPAPCATIYKAKTV